MDRPAQATDLRVTIVGGRNLAAKTDGKSDPYVEVFILNTKGEPIGKAKKTQVIKGNLNPVFNTVMVFPNPGDFTGLTARVWDKHRFRPDKHMGQVTVKFNVAKLQEADVDQWIPLSRRPGKSETVTGEVHLQVHYGLNRPAAKPAAAAAAPVPGPVHPVAPKPAAAGVQPAAAAPHVAKEVSGAEGERGHHPLKTSAHWNKRNEMLKNSALVVIEEEHGPADGADENDETLMLIRRGPQDPGLIPVTASSKPTINGNEVTASSAPQGAGDAVKTGVGVLAGRWFIEARLLNVGSGALCLGWAAASAPDDSWTLRIDNMTLYRKTEERLSNNDVIGMALDLERRTLSFYRNGKPLGAPHSDVHAGGGRLTPVFMLPRNARLRVSFGKEAFAYPVDEGRPYYPLYSSLSDKDIKALHKLYAEYKDVGIKLSESGDTGEVVKGQGTMQLYQDLGIGGDEDNGPLVLAFQLRSETVWIITREEFVNGFALAGCATIEQMRRKIAQWKEQTFARADTYKQFYAFCFDYLRQEKKILLMEEALIVWHMVLLPRKWGLYDKWVAFCRGTTTKAISRDSWTQLLEFALAYPRDLSNYDASSSWPSLLDDFVDWVAKHP